MAGIKQDKEKLNATLLNIAEIFFFNDIEEWFIVYGTLLGITRKNSCINEDDDVDIICNQKYYIKTLTLLLKNGYKLDPNINSPYIIKTLADEKSASIDIYMAEVDNSKNYIDLWEHIIWEKCHAGDNKFIKVKINKSQKEKYIFFYRLEYLLKRFKRKFIYIFFKKLIKIKPRWEKNYINLPINSEFMLEKVYGKDWRVEKKTKVWSQIRDLDKEFTNY